MRIAVPVAAGVLCGHFGRCEQFALFDVDDQAKVVTGGSVLPAPPHEPGALPQWLAEKGANIVIASSLGRRAQELFAEKKITVVTGAPEMEPQKAVEAYLAESLERTESECDHSGSHCNE